MHIAGPGTPSATLFRPDGSRLCSGTAPVCSISGPPGATTSASRASTRCRSSARQPGRLSGERAPTACRGRIRSPRARAVLPRRWAAGYAPARAGRDAVRRLPPEVEVAIRPESPAHRPVRKNLAACSTPAGQHNGSTWRHGSGEYAISLGSWNPPGNCPTVAVVHRGAPQQASRAAAPSCYGFEAAAGDRDPRARARGGLDASPGVGGPGPSPTGRGWLVFGSASRPARPTPPAATRS